MPVYLELYNKLNILYFLDISISIYNGIFSGNIMYIFVIDNLKIIHIQ